jgi:aryl-alcohol dehydrogenase-like predicted oxidoreductase
MEYRFLGRSGLRVSELCLGTTMFGERTDEQTSHQILDTFVEAGGTFLDTADVYSQGRSEEILGGWLKDKRRDDYVIATKAWGAMGTRPNDQGLSRRGWCRTPRCRQPSRRRARTAAVLGPRLRDAYQFVLVMVL